MIAAHTLRESRSDVGRPSCGGEQAIGFAVLGLDDDDEPCPYCGSEQGCEACEDDARDGGGGGDSGEVGGL